jgi:hypothetical protein
VCDNAAFSPVTADDFRRLALSMHDAVERAHMGHPDFRANGRIFATLHSNDRWGMVKLTPAEQREFMRASPEVFMPSSGAWGRQGCTNVRLDAADEATVRPAMILAWESVAARPNTGSTKTRSRTARPPGKAAGRARR